MRVLDQIKKRNLKQDLRGMLAREDEARRLATRASPQEASLITVTLGECNRCVGQNAKVITLLGDDKKIAEDLVDRAGVGRACDGRRIYSPVGAARLYSRRYCWRGRREDMVAKVYLLHVTAV
jgi:hypothetical protein